MNILVVSTKCPWPLNEGRALRTYNLLKQAAERHEITLCTYVQSQEEEEGLAEMRKFCKAVHAVPLYRSAPRLSLIADAIRELFGSVPLHAKKYARRPMLDLIARLARTESFDVLHLDMLHLGELRRAAPDLPLVLVQHNVESQILRRRLDNEKNPVLKAYLSYQTKKLERYEIETCNAADHVVTVSEEDADLLRELGVSAPIRSVPNAVDTEFFTPSETPREPDTLIYVGTLTWFPNEDAVRHFMSDIMPIIRQRRPDVVLKVIGKVPGGSKAAQWQGDPAIEFLGFVDDIRPHVAAAAVYVVPLRIGGGTRLKILDALAMGKALVTTAIGCEGLGLDDGQQAAIADDPTGFAEAVCALLSDDSRCAQLGANGRDYVCERFRWETIALGMDEVYAAAAGSR